MMHDFLTVGAPSPLQEAGVTALSMPESYYVEMAAGYARRRDLLCGILERLRRRLRDQALEGDDVDLHGVRMER